MAAGYSDGTVLMMRLEDGAEILVRRQGQCRGGGARLERKGIAAGLRHRGRRRRNGGAVGTDGLRRQVPGGTMRRTGRWYREQFRGERYVCRKQQAQCYEGFSVRGRLGHDGARHFGPVAGRTARSALRSNWRRRRQPLQSTPGAETKPSAPAEPVTTGTRPSGVPPEPARPDAEAQKAGAQPALPPAPAEKTAEPIKQR